MELYATITFPLGMSCPNRHNTNGMVLEGTYMCLSLDHATQFPPCWWQGVQHIDVFGTSVVVADVRLLFMQELERKRVQSCSL